MNQASNSTKSMMMSSVENGCQVSEPHQVCLQNLSASSWVDFLYFGETCIVANFDEF